MEETSARIIRGGEKYASALTCPFPDILPTICSAGQCPKRLAMACWQAANLREGARQLCRAACVCRQGCCGCGEQARFPHLKQGVLVCFSSIVSYTAYANSCMIIFDTECAASQQPFLCSGPAQYHTFRAGQKMTTHFTIQSHTKFYR